MIKQTSLCTWPVFLCLTGRSNNPGATAACRESGLTMSVLIWNKYAPDKPCGQNSFLGGKNHLIYGTGGSPIQTPYVPVVFSFPSLKIHRYRNRSQKGFACLPLLFSFYPSQSFLSSSYLLQEGKPVRM